MLFQTLFHFIAEKPYTRYLIVPHEEHHIVEVEIEIRILCNIHCIVTATHQKKVKEIRISNGIYLYSTTIK